MYTPAKDNEVGFLSKSSMDTGRQPISQRNTSPVNQPYYFKQNFLGATNNPAKLTELKNFQSLDNLHKQDSHYYKPQNTTNPLLSGNRGYLPGSPNNENNMMDFLQTMKSGAFTDRMEAPIKSAFDGFHDDRFLGMRRGSSSEAYLNAIKALQEKVSQFSERIKHLESENGFLKSFQEDQRVERSREERQFQDSTLTILEKLENINGENTALKRDNKELEERNTVLEQENKKLSEDKKKLKKKVVSLKSETKSSQKTVEELERILHLTQSAGEEAGSKAKLMEEQLQEELKGLKKEKEELQFKVDSLSEVVKKQENELVQGKKMYNQHLEKLALVNEALMQDNQQIKEYYSAEINEFGAELELIHEKNEKKMVEYKEDIAQLKKDNNRLTELLKLKNEELQAHKARNNKEEELKSELRDSRISLQTVRSRLTAIRNNQSPINAELSGLESPKLSILTNYPREKGEKGDRQSKHDQSSEDLYKQAKQLLTNQRASKGGRASIESSPGRDEFNQSKLTTKSHISILRSNIHDETGISRARSPIERTSYSREREGSEDNSGFRVNRNEVRSRAERKEAKYLAHAVRASNRGAREESPALDHSANDISDIRFTQKDDSVERKAGTYNYGTFGSEEKGIHQLFYGKDDSPDQKEVLESSRDKDIFMQKPRANKNFFDVIQGSR